jgi:hypothetical protein
LSDGGYPLSVLLLGFGVLGARKLKAEKNLGLLTFVSCWLVLPVPFIFLLLWIKDYFFAIRQILFVTPALFLLIALGICEFSQWTVWRNARKAAWTAVAVVGAISLISIGLHARDRNEDFRGAADFLRQNLGRSDAAYAPEVTAFLAFYFPELQERASPADALQQNGHANIFVVESRFMSAADRQAWESTWSSTPSASRAQMDYRGLRILEFRGLLSPGTAPAHLLLKDLESHP